MRPVCLEPHGTYRARIGTRASRARRRLHAPRLRLLVAVALLTVAWLAAASPSRASSASAPGTIAGTVVEQDTAAPLGWVVVRVVGLPCGAIADEEGHFTIRNVLPGTHDVEAVLVGHETQRIEGVSVQSGERAEVHFALAVAPIALREVVVTPGRFTIMREEPVARQTLSREDIHTIPQFGEDVYRAIRRLPGVTGSDFSAKFTVRGGEHEEILVLLDGVKLYEPFHLKDVDGGALSVVDVMAIGGIDMMTGAFPARYGGHLSGVFDMDTVTPREDGRTAVGISFMNARLLSEGRFRDGRGDWLVSARRGYLDLVLKMTGDDDISPVYHDVLGKVTVRLNEAHTLSAHVLHADDHVEWADRESGDSLGSDYGNSYGWLRLQSALGSRLLGQTVVSVGRVTRGREVVETDEITDDEGYYTGENRIDFELREDREFTALGFKQDWIWEPHPRGLVTGGFTLERLDATYDYTSRKLVFAPDAGGEIQATYETLHLRGEPVGTSLGLHAATRVRVLDPLTVETGVRHDRQSHTGDRDVSPRVNLVCALGERTAVRAGWGLFHQDQDVHDLDVAHGDPTFHRSQRSEHRVLGLEHGFRNGLELRVEAYQKKLTRIRPRYENLSRDVELAPELGGEVVYLEPESGEARGIELFVKRDTGGRFSFWVSYGLARAVERFNGVDVPKNHDQRHTIYMDGNYRPSRKWCFNLAWQYRSGWPFTEHVFECIEVPEGEWPYVKSFGPRNAARLPAYHRLDLRINRTFDVSGGRLSAFLEIINLYNRENVRDIVPLHRWNVVEGELIPVSQKIDGWFPILPSVGLSWEF